MSFRGKLSIMVISAAIAMYTAVGGFLAPWTRAQQPINDAGAQIRIFESVLQHIQNDYVDEPNLEKVRFGALRGLVGGLDPYSSPKRHKDKAKPAKTRRRFLLSYLFSRR